MENRTGWLSFLAETARLGKHDHGATGPSQSQAAATRLGKSAFERQQSGFRIQKSIACTRSSLLSVFIVASRSPTITHSLQPSKRKESECVLGTCERAFAPAADSTVVARYP
jgi:hypothetical protein